MACLGVLLLGGAAAVTDRGGGSGDPVGPPVQQGPAQGLPSPATVVTPPPVVAPVLTAVQVALPPAAQPDLDVASVLGPLPGPRDDPKPARTAAPADRYAFLAGVTDYRPPTLDTIASVADVLLVRDLLLDSGWREENIRIVTDEQATGAAVRDGMRWLAEHGGSGTFSLFHWSGHVKQRGGTREALWTVDRDFVDDTEVTAALSQVRGRLWVDVAACEAGSFVDGLPSDRVLFSASSAQTEKSYEYPPWGLSVWTGLLFDQGLRQGHADADGDGRATVGEALRYAQYQAQAVTLGQEPYGRQTPEWAGAADLGWTLADPPA